MFFALEENHIIGDYGSLASISFEACWRKKKNNLPEGLVSKLILSY